MSDIHDITQTKALAKKVAAQNDQFRHNILLGHTSDNMPKGRIVCTEGISARSPLFHQMLLLKVMNFGKPGHPKHFEVQHHTICEGWTNTWTTTNEDGVEEPHVFKTQREAQAELDEFINEIEREIKAGERSEDNGYSVEEFRVEPIYDVAESFTQDCDPYGWHEMGVIDVDGETVWFKFDYYDLDYDFGAEDPSDLSQTRRVLTLMLPSEY